MVMAEFEKTVCLCSKLLLRVLFGWAWELAVLHHFFSCVSKSAMLQILKFLALVLN